MMTFTCKVKNCVQKNVDYDFMGSPEFVECGNCGTQILGENLRPDPIITDEAPADITEA
jgi:hypothetical protein